MLPHVSDGFVLFLIKVISATDLLFSPSAAFTSFHIVCFYAPFEMRSLEVKL